VLPNVKLAFDDKGAGPCVVLVHGHPFDRSLWQPQINVLANRFRVVAPDLRGFGESPVTPGFVAIADYSRDVLELLDSIGVERAAIVGLSMGGIVAMDLATTYPDRCWALGLVATTAEPVTTQEQAIRRERADQIEREGIDGLIDYMHTGLYGSRADLEMRRTVDEMMARAPIQGAAAALRGRAERPDYRPRLRSLDLPAFVCTGSEDPWSNEEITAEIVAHLRHVETLVIDGAGHLPNLEAQETFTIALFDFLLRHSPAAAGQWAGLRWANATHTAQAVDATKAYREAQRLSVDSSIFAAPVRRIEQLQNQEEQRCST
jgi:3-oxoadipate enol-lactonase